MELRKRYIRIDPVASQVAAIDDIIESEITGTQVVCKGWQVAESWTDTRSGSFAKDKLQATT